MPAVRFFGGAAFDPGAGPHRGPAVQRRRLALLGVLAVYAPRGVSRDKLIAWFWPEENTERARHFLSDSVYVLRQALGRDAILAVGDNLLLNSEVVWTDVAAFREALGRGNHVRATEVYAGPFFDGVFIENAPELERWVQVERDRYAREYAQALEALAAGCEEAGETLAAVQWWRRLAEHEPLDARIATRLMLALDKAGDRTGAIRHARAYEARFREEMGGAAAPTAVRALADRLTTANGKPRVPSTLGETAPRAESALTATVTRRRTLAKPVFLVPAAILGILLLIPAGVWWRLTLKSSSKAFTHALVVVPFENFSGDSTQDHLGDGMTDGLIAELGRFERLRVISRTSAMRYKRTNKLVPQIARELEVDFVVEGTVARTSDSVFVTVHLVAAGDDRHMWIERYERPASEVLVLQEEIAREISKAMRIRRDRSSAAAARRVDPQAHDLYLRGRQARNRSREGLERAVVFFRQAIEREPEFAAAHAGLADAYVLLGFFGFLPAQSAFPKGKAAALRAIELGSLSADGHAALGLALTWERDWWGAESAFHRSIALKPGHATSRQWYALLLVTLGHMDEALSQAARASALDPLSLQINNNYGLLLYYSGEPAAALEQYRRIVEAEPDAGWVAESPWLLSNAARIYAANGLFPEARAAVERALAITPHHPRPLSDLAYVHIRMGQREDALRAIARADPTNAQTAYYFASVHAALGQADSAFHWLADVEDWTPALMSDLRMDPRLGALRDDPRYTQLLRELALL